MQGFVVYLVWGKAYYAVSKLYYRIKFYGGSRNPVIY